MKKTIFIKRFSSWAPGIQSREEWQQWAENKREISDTEESPALLWTDPLFRRRLSQISKMTIETLHKLTPFDDSAKIVFVSLRGELGRQFSINKTLVEDAAISPASFSLSVFNAPPALACIALNLKAGYSAIYPAHRRFHDGFLSTAAPLLSGSAEDIVLVYADEFVQKEYRQHAKDIMAPLAFAALLNARGEGEPIDCSVENTDLLSPQTFLKKLFSLRNVVYAI
ncbi:MAG: beta-ketoacyl synthase chain length factor [Spirochaetaceae bacterium]|jgi:hypothetical protein|nr:beta-ketoacyl synthase chain length factor [Spirochaetaceae bacterium]